MVHNKICYFYLGLDFFFHKNLKIRQNIVYSVRTFFHTIKMYRRNVLTFVQCKVNGTVEVI